MNGFRDRMRQHRRELAESAGTAERIAVPGGLVDAAGQAKAEAEKAAHKDGDGESAKDSAG
jgi:hypothetical protein